MIYFDAAATTLQKPGSVTRAMRRAADTLGSPGRGGHAAAMAAAEEAYACREAASELFHVCSPEQVVFCMNATHGLNLAIKSILTPGMRTVISGYEHNAVLRPLREGKAKLAIAASPLFRPEAALDAFHRELTADTGLCVVNHVSNVFGFIQPVSEIAELCRKRRIPLIVDASQSAGILPLDFEALGADFVAMPGHKSLYGPQGTGLLLCARPGKPLLEGGSGSDSRNSGMPSMLPDRLEAGTHNMPGIAGLRQGIRFVQSLGTEKILRHECMLRQRLCTLLEDNPAVRLYASDREDAQTGVLSFSLAETDCETAAAALSEAGIALRAGLHCAPLAHDTAGTDGTLRASFSVFNTPRELKKLVSELENFR